MTAAIKRKVTGRIDRVQKLHSDYCRQTRDKDKCALLCRAVGHGAVCCT
jgi:hypothetical protein